MAFYSPFLFFLSQFFWIINPSICYFFLGYQFIYMLFFIQVIWKNSHSGQKEEEM